MSQTRIIYHIFHRKERWISFSGFGRGNSLCAPGTFPLQLSPGRRNSSQVPLQSHITTVYAKDSVSDKRFTPQYTFPHFRNRFLLTLQTSETRHCLQYRLPLPSPSTEHFHKKRSNNSALSTANDIRADIFLRHISQNVH